MTAASVRQWSLRAVPWLARGLQLALALLILWLLAGLVWRVLTPTPPALPAARSLDANDTAAAIAAANLFGTPGAATNSTAAAAPSNLVLRGVIAAKGKKRAVAIVSLNGADVQVVAEGESIGAGLTLDRVYSDRIDVGTPAGRQTVELAR